MISVNGLTKYYGDFKAVNHLNFQINQGEILGLLGPNGAGKTTTLRMLTGYLSPTEGNAFYKDKNIREDSLFFKHHIGYLPESAPVYQNMLVYDYLDYISDMRRVPKDIKEEKISKTAELCGLMPVMHKPVHTLSKGYKQRVGLAHAMTGEPEILILDEPTSGLDPNQIIEIRDLIKNIGKEKTVIFSSHILSEVEATCDRIIIINQGKIAADSSITELKNSRKDRYVLRLSLLGADFESAQNLFKKIDGVNQTEEETSEDNRTLNLKLTIQSSNDLRPEIYDLIKTTDWKMTGFEREIQTLEHIFRNLTKEQEKSGRGK